MNRSKHTVHAQVLSTFAVSAIALALTSACGNSQSTGSQPPVGTSLEELTTDLGVCSVARATCMQAADGDVSKNDACQSEASDCRSAVQAASQEIHTAIRACATTARSCFMSAADAGPSARQQCGQQLRSCVEMALPPPPPLPPCAAALKGCLADTRGDAGGGQAARMACFSTFHSCVEATLPPCMHELATCLDDHTQPPFVCARQAAACRRYRITHDGGLPPSAGGAKGSGGSTSVGGSTSSAGATSVGGSTSTAGATGAGGG